MFSSTWRRKTNAAKWERCQSQGTPAPAHLGAVVPRSPRGLDPSGKKPPTASACWWPDKTLHCHVGLCPSTPDCWDVLFNNNGAILREAYLKNQCETYTHVGCPHLEVPWDTLGWIYGIGRSGGWSLLTAQTHAPASPATWSWGLCPPHLWGFAAS